MTTTIWNKRKDRDTTTRPTTPGTVFEDGDGDLMMATSEGEYVTLWSEDGGSSVGNVHPARALTGPYHVFSEVHLETRE